MGKDNNRFNALLLKLCSIFANRRNLFLSAQESHTGCAGRRYLAWRCFGNHADKSDFNAAYFFDGIRFDNRFPCIFIYCIGINIVKIHRCMGNFFIYWVYTAKNLCFKCCDTLVKLMVAQSSDIELHQVHPFQRRLVALP
ncbi:hypothetical protein D3C73_1321590 [compost metagenome]